MEKPPAPGTAPKAPSREEIYNKKIEQAEAGLRAEFSELQTNTSSLEKDFGAVPEEKKDWYLGTYGKSYEKAQNRLKEASLVLGGIGGALLVSGMFTMSTEDIARDNANLGANTMISAVAIYAVGYAINFARAKISDWQEDRRISAEYDRKTKQA